MDIVNRKWKNLIAAGVINEFLGSHQEQKAIEQAEFLYTRRADL